MLLGFVLVGWQLGGWITGLFGLYVALGVLGSVGRPRWRSSRPIG